MKRTAWIIGAGPGIGRAAAARFRAEGYEVGAIARPGEHLELGSECLILGADAFDPEALKAALDELERRLGPPSVLVYNASMGTPGPLAETSPEEAAAQLHTAACSLLSAVARVIPAMEAARQGTLLVTGGGLAFEPKAGLALPSAVKTLQRSLTLSLAHDLEPKGIHVATLAVRGFVQPGTPLSPETVAQALWELHAQAPGTWQRERVLNQ
jgi:short-subunit dehydrogenase